LRIFKSGFAAGVSHLKERKICSDKRAHFNNKSMGKQKMHLLNSTTAFHVSAITRAFKGYEKNIRRLIEHTNIKNVQWINFNKRDIILKTIK